MIGGPKFLMTLESNPSSDRCNLSPPLFLNAQNRVIEIEGLFPVSPVEFRDSAMPFEQFMDIRVK